VSRIGVNLSIAPLPGSGGPVSGAPPGPPATPAPRPPPGASTAPAPPGQRASRVFHPLSSRSLPLPDVQDLPLGASLAFIPPGALQREYPSGIHPAG
jgi:hypothetical protein